MATSPMTETDVIAFDQTTDAALSADTLRLKAYGIVTRVANDGTWADMVWWQGPPNLNRPPDGCAQWRKRQPLNQINECWNVGERV